MICYPLHHRSLLSPHFPNVAAMKFLICAALLAVAADAAFIRGAVPQYTANYHAQDELGQYSFGHQQPNQARAETKDAYGIVRGSYSYTNPDGSIVTNNYIADENGFRSSLAPSNGPLLPLTGKVPKAPVAAAYVAAPAFAPPTVALRTAPIQVVESAPVHVASPVVHTPAFVHSPAIVKAEEKPAAAVKVSGAHVAPAVPVNYAYPSYPYSPYAAAYAAPYAGYAPVW